MSIILGQLFSLLVCREGMCGLCGSGASLRELPATAIEGTVVGMTFLAGGVQLTTATGDAAANVAKMERLGRSLKEKNPQLALLAFPELALTGYSAGAGFYELAEPWPDGTHLSRLAGLARELGVVLVVGYAEASSARGLIYDSAAVFDYDGRPVASCRKTHCLDSERQFFANGDQLSLIATSLGVLGVMICWDAAFPEVARTLALEGADLLVTIGAWEDPYVGDWELVAAARAYDNVIPVVAVNRTGADGDVQFSGHSCIVDCLGHPVPKLGDEQDGLLVGTVDFDKTREVRAGYGSQLRDRRPELYAAVSAPATALSGSPSPPERE
jgi:predicted amidohydrolase